MLASTIRQSSPQAACRPSKARELKAILRLGCRSRQSCRRVRHQHGRHRTSRAGHGPIAAACAWHGGCEGRKPMLRITDTLHVTPDGRATWTLRLEGTLKDEWVRELRHAWRRVREAQAGADRKRHSARLGTPGPLFVRWHRPSRERTAYRR